MDRAISDLRNALAYELGVPIAGARHLNWADADAVIAVLAKSEHWKALELLQQEAEGLNSPDIIGLP